MGGKSPISAVKEWCGGLHTTPVYEEILDDLTAVKVHPRIFTFRLTAWEWSTIGTGRIRVYHSYSYSVLHHRISTVNLGLSINHELLRCVILF